MENNEKIGKRVNFTEKNMLRLDILSSVYKKEIEGIKKMLESGMVVKNAENEQSAKTPTSIEDLKKMPDSEYFGVPKTPSKDLNSEGLFNKFPQPFDENKNTYKPTQTTAKSYMKMDQTLMVNEIKREAPVENEDSKKKEVIDYTGTYWFPSTIAFQ